MIWAKYRNWLLILVYVLFFLHAAIWHYWGYEGIGHLGFGEPFGTLRTGIITAGTVFTFLIFLHALFFGGLFCGWLCHWGITQDFIAGIMKRLGIKPIMANFNSRLIPWLWFLILIAQVVIFWIYNGFPTSFSFNPSATAVWSGVPRSIFMICITTLVSGMLLIFLFGERAFCRSICTFRLWFSWFEKIAPHKIRQIKECSSCSNECTASCPMGIPIAQEVAKLGHIKNQECIKCHICIGACPHKALAPSLCKNEFHKQGEQIIPPSDFSNSINWLQLAFAIIFLTLAGFSVGANMSLSLGLLSGFFFVFFWKNLTINYLIAILIVILPISYYYAIDFNDMTSLAKGLTLVFGFLFLGKLIGFQKEHEFIKNSARKADIPYIVSAVIIIIALGFGARESYYSFMIHKANSALKGKDVAAYASIMDGHASFSVSPANTYFDVAKAQLSLNQPDKAVNSFKKSLEISFTQNAADAALGFLFEAKYYSNCYNLAKYLSEKHPAIEKFRIAMANSLLSQGNYTEAEKIFAESVRLDPLRVDSILGLSEVKIKNGKIDEAIKLLNNSISIKPELVTLALARTYAELNQLAKAESAYKQALLIVPEDMHVMLEAADNIAGQGKLWAAIKMWNKILEKAPNNPCIVERIKNGEEALAVKKAEILGINR